MLRTIQRAKAAGWAVVVADPHRDEAIAPHQHLVKLWMQALKPCADRPLLVLAHSYGAALSIGMLKAAEASGAAIQHVLALALTDGMVGTPAGWQGGAALVHEGRQAHCTDEELCAIAPSGGDALATLKAQRDRLRQHVKAVPSAFGSPSDGLLAQLRAIACNWVVSAKPLGRRVSIGGPRESRLATVSAGVTSHPATTHAALDDIFAFLERAATKRVKRTRQAE